MPTYEYIREDGSTFEIIQKMSDPTLQKCPTTGQKVTRAIGSGAGLIFKGSGFYETDYVKKSGTPDAESKSESKPASKEKSTSETKSAKKKKTTKKESD